MHKKLSASSRGIKRPRAYCQINDPGNQIGEAEQQKDRTKAEAVVQKMNELEKQLGPEYLALVDAMNDVDPNSSEGQEIESLFDKQQ